MISIQQAAANALATYLQDTLGGDILVESRWPDARRLRKPKVISVLLAGRREDLMIDPRILSRIDMDTTQSEVRWQIKTCKQSLQLDVWCQNDIDRDDIVARLDIALNAGASPVDIFAEPVASGLLLATNSGDEWPDTFCDFSFDGPEIDNTDDSVNITSYRATYMGDAHVMLAVSKPVARQVLIQFQQKLSEFPVSQQTGPYDLYSIT